MVDPKWASAPTTAVKISPEATSTESMQYDVARTRSVVFRTQRIDASTGAIKNEMVDAKARKIMVAPPGSASVTKPFGTGSPQTRIDATGMFPFTSSYAVYAGDCTGARPADAVALAPRPAVPASALATATGDVVVLMPAVNLTVTNSTGTTPEKNVEITLYSKKGDCSAQFRLGDNAVTDDKGRLSVDGAVAAPFGTYDYCVKAPDGRTAKGFVTNGTDVTKANNGLDNTNPAGASKTVNLGTSTGGTCP